MKFFKKHKKRKIIIIVFIVIVALIGGIYGSIMWTFYKDMVRIADADDIDPTADEVLIAKEEQKDDDVTNILLVGTDSRDPDSDMGRSDSMMLVSFNSSKNKATAASFLRDSLVDIDGYGKSRLGHTYAYGGVGLTINTINKTYDLDIQKYVIINFENLVSVMDEIGGVEVHITAEEAEYYRQNGMPDIQEGTMTLTGAQALAHARNRKLDSDFGRTRRQRDVIYGIYNKIMQTKDPASLLPLINYCMTQVQTNLSVNEIYSLAKEILAAENLQTRQTSVPAEETYKSITYEGMSVLEIDFEANKERLKEFLY